MQMNGKQYLETQMQIVQIAKAAGKLDLDAFLKVLDNAEHSAPILDPTLFRKAHENLLAIKALAASLKAFKEEFHKQFEVISKNTQANLATLAAQQKGVENGKR